MKGSGGGGGRNCAGFSRTVLVENVLAAWEWPRVAASPLSVARAPVASSLHLEYIPVVLPPRPSPRLKSIDIPVLLPPPRLKSIALVGDLAILREVQPFDNRKVEVVVVLGNVDGTVVDVEHTHEGLDIAAVA